MLIEAIIFIIGCSLISLLLYKKIDDMWYDNIMKRTLKGHDTTGLTDSNEFKEMFADVSKQIIRDYEAHKKKKEDKNKQDEMYQ